ncbi:hypothetical protein PAA8504_02967 [Palleronia abyssalis]|uniref:Response regulatory domain-containing protein n=2 Tax=Palleronia abyssalis TaxID=1501240 RepID=A0A2R8BY81_9RHOB|nr:hypothetical protein PAA8504_02967 [Palleronia abyssalis]
MDFGFNFGSRARAKKMYDMSSNEPTRVLVLEDEPMILMELAFAVEDRGGQPISTHSVEQAMEAISSTPPHAAILDVNLGRGTTCESVAKSLQEAGIPFILHSGDLIRQGELIARIGAEVIAKPASSDTVADRALALARSRATN